MSQDGSIDRWGRSATGAANPAFMSVYRNWFRVEWEGLEHIPNDGGVISAGIQEELDRPVYSLAHHGFFRFPFVGRFIAASGGVVGHPENAHRLLSEDKSLVLVFPEGAKGPTKSPDQHYRLQRFGRGGFVETAMRAGVPIVPIALLGTEDATPMITTFRLAGQDVPITLNALLFGPLLGAFLQFPAKIKARVLPPMHFDEEPNLAHYPRSRVMDHSEEVRTRLQTAVNQMRARRKSVWRG